MRVPFIQSSRSSNGDAAPSEASSESGFTVLTPSEQDDTDVDVDSLADAIPSVMSFGTSSTFARTSPSSDLSLSIHPIPAEDALIIRAQPPKAPATALKHVPCDIVLVIDVSGSMMAAAPVPGSTMESHTGLTVLDLVRHAALTIIETLDANDRLGIVTFEAVSRVVQPLKPMGLAAKRDTKKKIEALRPLGATNLWAGIKDGLGLFSEVGPSGNVPAVMVLTDGMPNCMCPPQGYVPKLRTMMPLPATIHTFGFGYDLRSGLLKSIAELCNGNYAFIPDAGMIGTAFVNATANLQTTYATEARLTLVFPPIIRVEHFIGESLDQKPTEPEWKEQGDESNQVMELSLGNLQFGQSRDIFLQTDGMPNLQDLEGLTGKMPEIRAALEFRPVLTTRPEESAAAAGKRQSAGQFGKPEQMREIMTTYDWSQEAAAAATLSDADIAYHESRARICRFILSIFPLGPDGERYCKMYLPTRPEYAARYAQRDAKATSEIKTQLKELKATIPAQHFSDPRNKSLMDDLAGVIPHGQISLAVENDEYFDKWGRHYLLSYVNAHTRQICNTFKDPGPLLYGSDSPMFLSCRNSLDQVFDSIPPPKPSARTQYSAAMPRSMSSYNSASGPCFAGSARVELASGRSVPVRKLRKGSRVQTQLGARRVAAVLKTPVRDEVICRVGDLLVTPWHPISLDGKVWNFPAEITEHPPVRYTGAVYSILLQRDANPDAHGIFIGGMWGVTLGHGITGQRAEADDGEDVTVEEEQAEDVRVHAFLGDYDAVKESLMNIGMGKDGVAIGGGVVRLGGKGMVCGFKRAERGLESGTGRLLKG